MKIDTQELREQGASLKTRMEKIIQSYAEQQQQGQQEQGASPKSVKGGVMYDVFAIFYSRFLGMI
ncbi:MAG: hypothetical protein WBF33_17570 [Candidatus Nitrosopolaris sp.]